MGKEGETLREVSQKRLQKSLEEILANRRVLHDFLAKVNSLSASSPPEKLEAFITERLGPNLPALVSIIEASDNDLNKAMEDLQLKEDDRQELERLREAYVPHKALIQVANLYEQGYLNRITNVRHRPYVFLYSNIPAIDLTLRSFDRNILRVVDTLDNALGLAAGITEAVTGACERMQAISGQIKGDVANRLRKQIVRISSAVDKIQSTFEQETPSEEAAAKKRPSEIETTPAPRRRSKGRSQGR